MASVTWTSSTYWVVRRNLANQDLSGLEESSSLPLISMSLLHGAFLQRADLFSVKYAQRLHYDRRQGRLVVLKILSWTLSHHHAHSTSRTRVWQIGGQHNKSHAKTWLYANAHFWNLSGTEATRREGGRESRCVLLGTLMQEMLGKERFDRPSSGEGWGWSVMGVSGREMLKMRAVTMMLNGSAGGWQRDGDEVLIVRSIATDGLGELKESQHTWRGRISCQLCFYVQHFQSIKPEELNTQAKSRHHLRRHTPQPLKKNKNWLGMEGHWA